MKRESFAFWLFRQLRSLARTNKTIEAILVRLIQLLKLQEIENRIFTVLQRSRRKPYQTYRDWVEATLGVKLPLDNLNTSTANPSRVFIVTPTPPSKSGVAMYSLALAKQLQQSFQVVLVSEFDSQEIKPIAWMSPTEFLLQWRPGDKVVYQFGNNTLHQFQEELLKKIPGIVELHDVNLRDYEAQKYTSVWAEGIIEQLIHQKAPQVFGLNLTSVEDLPALNSRILSFGTHIIVHNDAAKLEILENNPLLSKEDVSVILLSREDKSIPTREQARKILGFEESQLVISTFGFAGMSKLTFEILLAVKQLSSTEILRGKSLVLNIVGEVGPKAYARLLKAKLGVNTNVRVNLTGWVSDEQYANYLSSTDLAIQLRSSENLESSNTILDCLFSGVPTIISSNEANSHFSDEFVIRTTERELFQTLQQVVHSIKEYSIKAMLARPRVVKSYGLEASISQHLQLISEQPPHTSASVLERESRELRRVFVDVTSTAVNDNRTGIQRVVKRLVGEWLKDMDVLSVEFVPVFFASGRSKFYSAEKFRADLLDWPAQAFSSNEVEPKPGDVYLGLDLQSSDQLQNELFNWKEKGASVYFVLYDVLPLVNPTFFPEVALERFAKWAKMTSKFDGVFSISKTALGDYVNIFQPQASDFKTGVFTLGADFTTNFLDLGPKPPIVHSRSQIEFLMVGTLEPRKGHLEVLEGFHKLWNQGFQGRLTIVGKWGWKIADTRAVIHNSPFKNGLLRVINDASDSELANHYRDSDCLIAASYNEGFGLPLVEAAQHGLRVLARDIPIFREVGGDSIDYFDSGTDFSQQLSAWSKKHQNGETLPGGRLAVISWKETAEELVRLIRS